MNLILPQCETNLFNQFIIGNLTAGYNFSISTVRAGAVLPFDTFFAFWIKTYQSSNCATVFGEIKYFPSRGRGTSVSTISDFYLSEIRFFFDLLHNWFLRQSCSSFMVLQLCCRTNPRIKRLNVEIDLSSYSF